MLGVWIVEKSFGFRMAPFMLPLRLLTAWLNHRLSIGSYHFLELPFFAMEKAVYIRSSRPV